MTRLRIAHLRLLAPLVVIAWTAGSPLDDNSFLWHVRAGTVQLDLGRVLTTDPFSLTENGAAWRTQSWLAELGYGWLERATGGIEWVVLMKLLLMLFTVVLVGLVVYRVVGRHQGFTLVGVLLLVWQSAPFGVARPALIGYGLLAVAVAFVFMDRRPLWLLPPLFWLWASIHGTFPVGLGLIALDALRRRSRRQGIAVVLAGVATGFTAHGIGIWWVVVQFLRNRGALAMISEWQPPDFTNPFLLPLVIVVIGVLVAAVLGRLEVSDLWIIIPFTVFGITAERNVWPAFIVLIPFAMMAFPRRATAATGRTESVVANWAIAVLLVGLAVAGVVRPFQLREDRFPPAAALAALEDGPLYSGTAIGGFLIYADWPDHLVFIDDRAELYGADGFERYHDIETGVGVEDTFTELGIRQVLVGADWPVVGYLELLGWQYRYEDDNFVVMGE